MKTAILFPGLDALFMASRLKRWLSHSFIQNTLDETSQYLAEVTDAHEDLGQFIAVHPRLHLADFDRTLVALTSLQVAIARELSKTYTWDVIQGCSHGDIARSVICGSLELRDAIHVLWAFAEMRKICPQGSTANVRTRDGSALTGLQLNWLRDRGLPVSQWSDTHATIGGTQEAIQTVVDSAELVGIKVKPVLPYPVHSPAMQPCVDILREISPQWPVRDPQSPVFSSVWVRYIQTADEIREEALASSVHEVKWVDTLSALHSKEGITHFLNVGPSNTLTSWLFNSPRFSGIQLSDSWEVLGGEVRELP